MKVWVIVEIDQGRVEVVSVYSEQERAYSKLLSLTDFARTPTAEYLIFQRPVL